ncbi:LiaF transmembrane domain-containing protein [Roseimarinus sediminis]|uniref:LiaF transmembrane domain-containing protein n=1 Tax=Roseimarinus sediminis TaxID=1610899 RepID=UPI003D21A8E1
MDKRHNVNGRRFFFGFILLLIGLIMILERAGILSWEIYDFLLSWKMLLVAIGGFVFFSGNKGAGIIVMGLGAFFMIPDIFEDYDQIKRFFWPGILLLVGLTFMFGNRKKLMRSHYKPGVHAEVSNDFFDEFVLFGGREINMATPNLLGGRSTAIFGGAEVDLRQCQISHNGCTVELTTLFGGNVLKVPNDWTVLNKVTTIFGGYSDLRIKDPMYAPNPSKTIVITGVCIFGGTEVRNFDKAH